MTNPPIEEKQDFFALNEAPPEIEDLVRTACYDCHSHETSYPWYSQVAPISWWLNGHIEHGREHLNFSTWGSLEADDLSHGLHECQEVLEEKEMPMLTYMIMHRDAWIDEEQRNTLAQYFESLEH